MPIVDCPARQVGVAFRCSIVRSDPFRKADDATTKRPTLYSQEMAGKWSCGMLVS